eukprot:jgi/Phyca11/565583/estExt2_Genewise1.C_PHYCAscaffold_180403
MTHLTSLKWLIEEYFPDHFLTKAVLAADAGGHLDILKWLYVDHRNLGYWGGVEIGRPIWKQDSKMIEWLKANAEPHSECAANLILVAAAHGDQGLTSGVDTSVIWYWGGWRQEDGPG